MNLATSMQDVYNQHFDRGPVLNDPPQAVVDSMLDATTGRIHFANVGGLLTIPPDKHHPPLVAQTLELLTEAGTWCSQLASRAGAICALPVVDDRALQAGKLAQEVDGNVARFSAALRAKIAEMNSTVASLSKALREESTDLLPTEIGQRIAVHFYGLDPSSQSAFIRRAEANRDWRIMRAISDDPLAPYLAPSLDRDGLRDKAGALRHPTIAGMVTAYRELAERTTRNLARLTESATKASAMAAQNTEAAKLELVRRSLRAGRPSELAG